MLSITKEIQRVENTIESFMRKEKNKKHFNRGRVRFTTISILGFLDLLVNFKNLEEKDIKNKLNGYNEEYLPLLENIDINNEKNSTLFFFEDFWLEAGTFLQLNEYEFLTSTIEINKLKIALNKKCFKFENEIFKNKLFGSMLEFVILTYFFNQEIPRKEMRLFEQFKCYHKIEEFLSKEFLSTFKKEINVILGRKCNLQIIQHAVFSLNYSLWENFIYEKLSKKEVLKTKLIHKIIEKEKIKQFSFSFLEKHLKNKSRKNKVEFESIIFEIINNVISMR